MNYADIKNCDISNGDGIRVSLFVSGCRHHCEGCFNQVAWDFNYGKPFTNETIEYILDLMKPSYIKGITLLGGEPLELSNIEGLIPLLEQIKSVYPQKDIWCYSGFTLEQLLSRNDNNTNKILSMIDILVDGKFVQSLYDIKLKFRGSSNQRIIDLKQTLKNSKIVLYYE